MCSETLPKEQDPGNTIIVVQSNHKDFFQANEKTLLKVNDSIRSNSNILDRVSWSVFFLIRMYGYS